jgi:hypothetical protein
MGWELRSARLLLGVGGFGGVAMASYRLPATACQAGSFDVTTRQFVSLAGAHPS